MPISVPAGSFRQGGDFFSIAIPAIAKGLEGITAGMKEREETERKRALEDLSNLVQLHGKDVVNQPNFRDLYKRVFREDWPSVTEEIPAVMGKEKVPGAPKTMPLQGKFGEIAAGPSESRFLQPGGPGVQGMPQKIFPTTEERDIEISPARTDVRPAPLGGAMPKGPTLGQLLPGIPTQLSNLTVDQAKSLGFDLDKFLFPEPESKAQVEGRILSDYIAGKPGTPQAQAYLQHMLTSEPKTMEQFIVQQIQKVGYPNLPPALRSWVDNWMQAQTKVDTKEAIMKQVAEKGIGSLTEGQYAIWSETIARPPDKPYKETFADVKLEYIRNPQFRAMVDKDPVLKQMVTGQGTLAIGGLKEAQAAQAKAEANFAAALAKQKAVESALILKGRHGPQEWSTTPPSQKAGVPDWNAAYQATQAARAARDAWSAKVKELQTVPQQQMQGGIPMDELPDPGQHVPGTVVYDSATGQPAYVLKQDPKTKKNYWEPVK